MQRLPYMLFTAFMIASVIDGQEKAKDAYPGFRPCKVEYDDPNKEDRKLLVDERPYTERSTATCASACSTPTRRPGRRLN